MRADADQQHLYNQHIHHNLVHHDHHNIHDLHLSVRAAAVHGRCVRGYDNVDDLDDDDVGLPGRLLRDETGSPLQF